VSVPSADIVPLAPGVRLIVAVRSMLAVRLSVPSAEGVPLALGVRLAVSVPSAESVPLTLGVELIVAVRSMVNVLLAVAVDEGVWLPVRVPTALTVWLRLNVGLMIVADPSAVNDGVAVAGFHGSSSVAEYSTLRGRVQSVVPAVLVMYPAAVPEVHVPRKYCRVGSGSAPARSVVTDSLTA
jgi:hypothetical protein